MSAAPLIHEGRGWRSALSSEAVSHIPEPEKQTFVPAARNAWTPERRARQAQMIQAWAPWKRSTGPKSVVGKAVVARNADKGRAAVEAKRKRLVARFKHLFNGGKIDLCKWPEDQARVIEAYQLVEFVLWQSGPDWQGGRSLAEAMAEAKAGAEKECRRLLAACPDNGRVRPDVAMLVGRT